VSGVAARVIEVTGTVQGVGFRPFVWRLATELGIRGSVRNLGGQVRIEAVGPAAALDRLMLRLRTDAPPRAEVETVTATTMRPDQIPDGFAVVGSTDRADGIRLFPPDLATCEACLRELDDPSDRRYRYPFINCTDCGPRASIIDGLPYDRARTTMVDFPMCAACRAEYEDPADRRFHAEPIACPDCGPRLSWTAGAGTPPVGEQALSAAVVALAGGAVVAVKGLGGYHLACDATDPAAVARLRERKRRPTKPLAVLVPDLAAAGRLAVLDPVQRAVLSGSQRPIVLAPSRVDSPLAPGVTHGAREVGLLLAYTGTHHLLARGLGRPLVLTSGNRSSEPIAIDDSEALERLAGIADGFLTHDRRIRARYEDSVVRVTLDRVAPLRRARGYAPRPVALPVPSPVPILAVGAQLKHTFTLAAGARAYVSPHTGDLEDLATHEAFLDSLAHLRRLLGLEPAVVVHDRHPGYLSTQFAVELSAGQTLAVQHHHAHIASCAAEHGLTGPVVGVALDGLGLGDDGTFWGGEVLVADLIGYRRVARFGQAPMPGGAAAVREPWRMALGYLYGAEFGGIDAADAAVFAGRFDPLAVSVIRHQIDRRINAPIASSAGRLFDAASALLGLGDVTTYEAEAAMALERAADPDERRGLPARIRRVGPLAVYDPGPTLSALLRGRAAGLPAPSLAARFQHTVASVVVRLARDAARTAGLDTVCLSGGVFANQALSTVVTNRLAGAGLRVLRNTEVPTGDGGISYGQAAIAAARLADSRRDLSCASASQVA
jgi:hydrogenase maturation protein HypF